MSSATDKLFALVLGTLLTLVPLFVWTLGAQASGGVGFGSVRWTTATAPSEVHAEPGAGCERPLGVSLPVYPRTLRAPLEREL